MDDGSLTLTIGADLADRLKASAESVGRSVGDYARDLIRDGLEDDWAEEEARWAEYERTGEPISADVALSEFRSAVEKRLAARR